MVIATAVTWPVYTYVLVPLNLDYLQTVVFILIIAALVQLLETVMHKYMPPLYNALGIYLPLHHDKLRRAGRDDARARKKARKTRASAIWRRLSTRSAQASASWLQWSFSPVCVSASSCATCRISSKVWPITVIAASLVAVSFLGFNGIIDRLLA